MTDINVLRKNLIQEYQIKMDQAQSPVTKELYKELIRNVDHEIYAITENLFYKTPEQIESLLKAIDKIWCLQFPGCPREKLFGEMHDASRVMFDAIRDNLGLIKHFKSEVINLRFDDVYYGFATLVELYVCIKTNPSVLNAYRLTGPNEQEYVIQSTYKLINGKVYKYKGFHSRAADQDTSVAESALVKYEQA